jgi:septal ring factor EnvC (AmiA/AmiB activator)
MSEQNIKDLLVQLQQELEKAETVDSETMDLVRELDDDIHRLVDPESDLNDFDSVIDRANAMETRFAVEHPRAERFLREIINALSRVGI